MSNLEVSIIGGCGHVGLPLGIVFAASGINVKLIDINKKAIEQVNDGELPFKEEGAKSLLEKALRENMLTASCDPNIIHGSDFIIFITGTPIDEHLNPKFSDVTKVVSDYLDYITPEMTVILRSTNYPGVYDLVEKLLFEKFGTAKLAFCPERILQGKAIHEIKELPQIISSNCKDTLSKCEKLFKKNDIRTISLTPKEAEFGKLMTNSWRYLEFAIANQFYMMAEADGIDFYKVFEAITKDYPRAKNFKGPGLTAGPCLFKDTMQLSAFSNNSFFLGHSAMLINEGLPRFLVSKLENIIGSLKGKKIGILGMTFKPNCDDIRDSLSFKIKKEILLKMGLPYETDVYWDEGFDLKFVLENSDAIILATPHDEYKNLKINKPIIDCWGFLEQ